MIIHNQSLSLYNAEGFRTTTIKVEICIWPFAHARCGPEPTPHICIYDVIFATLVKGNIPSLKHLCSKP